MKNLIPFLLILLLAQYSAAQEKATHAFTVQEAVDYALQNNNTAKNAKLGIDQAKWRNVEIYTTGLPQISASIDYSYYFKQPQSPALSKIFADTTMPSNKIFGMLASDPTFAANNPALAAQIGQTLYNSAVGSKDSKISFVLPHNVATGIQISQLFFDGRYVFGVKASKDLMKTARLSSQMSDNDVKYSVMKAYYQAEAAIESKSLLNENLTLVDKLLADTRAIFEQGLIEELDVNRLELVKANLENQINLQNQMSEVALVNLKFQMGLPLNDDIILKDNLTELKKDISQQLALQFDAKQRIEYQMLETAVKLQEYNMRQKRVQYFPSLYGFLNYGWNSQVEKFGDFFKSTTTTYPDGDTRKRNAWYDQGLVGLSLKVPIFDSGLKLAQVKQAKIDQLKTKNDFENFKNASELQFKAAQSSFNAAVLNEANTLRTQDLSKKIFDKNTVKFKEGVGSSFELVQSETDYVTNQLKQIQSSLNLLNTKADLDKAMGVK